MTTIRTVRKKREGISPVDDVYGQQLAVRGSINNVDELRGLRRNPQYMVRAPENIHVLFDSNLTPRHEILTEYDRKTDDMLKEIRRLSKERRRLVRSLQLRYRQVRQAALSAIRLACMKRVEVFTFRKHTEVRTAVWYTRLWIPKEFYARFGVDPSAASLTVSLTEKQVASLPSTPLIIKGAGRYVRVKRTKRYEVVVNKRIVTGTRLRLDRKTYAHDRHAWISNNPMPAVAQNSEYRRLTDRMVDLSLKAKNSYHPAFGATTNGALGLTSEERKSFRDYVQSQILEFMISSSWLRWQAFPADILQGALTARSFYDGTDPDTGDAARVYYPERREDAWGAGGDPFNKWVDIPRDTTLVRDAFNRVLDNGEWAKSFVGLTFPVREAPFDWRSSFSPAQLALEAGDIGRDDLGGFNAFRSLAELKDLGRVPSQVRDFYRFLRSPIGSAGPLKGAVQTIKAASSAYLMWKFAVQPTVSDTRTLLKETRESLLTARRGLWNVVRSLRRLRQCGMTIRKFVSMPMMDSEAGRLELRKLFPDEFTRNLVINHTGVTYGRCQTDPWPQVLRPADPYDTAARPEFTGTMTDMWKTKEGPLGLFDLIPENCRPTWVVLPEKPVYFARLTLSEAVDRCDPSLMWNLVQTMKLPKTVWELFPLSFVVDWLATTGQVATNATNYLSSLTEMIWGDREPIIPWYSQRMRLYLVCPCWRRASLRSWCSNPEFEDVYTTATSGKEALRSCTCELEGRWVLDDVKVIRTGITSFARDCSPDLQWSDIWLPRVKLNLGMGKLISLLALLGSSTK